jgi:inhibitor of cysteine peptidase
MRKFKWVIALLGAVMFMQFAEAKVAPAVYTEDKPAVLLKPSDEEFVIKLRSNPTTGYSWFLRDYSPNLIVPVKHEYLAPDSKLVGAPGIEVWTFAVGKAALVVPQQTVIRFVYARPWATDDQGKQLVFKVTTQGSAEKFNGKVAK